MRRGQNNRQPAVPEAERWWNVDKALQFGVVLLVAGTAASTFSLIPLHGGPAAANAGVGELIKRPATAVLCSAGVMVVEGLAFTYLAMQQNMGDIFNDEIWLIGGWVFMELFRLATTVGLAAVAFGLDDVAQPAHLRNIIYLHVLAGLASLRKYYPGTIWLMLSR